MNDDYIKQQLAQLIKESPRPSQDLITILDCVVRELSARGMTFVYEEESITSVVNRLWEFYKDRF